MPKTDEGNLVFKYAAQFVLNGMDDDTDVVFLTGKAGTGKTTFLKYIADNVENRVILAPTGVAAVNAGGQTIHSFFRINPNILYTPENIHTLNVYALNDERKKAIQKMELLIIDEVSMLRCELLDVVDYMMRKSRQSNRPFGGVPTLLIGDVFQLPPVRPDDEWKVLQKYYDTEFFFSSYAYKQSRTKFFELDKVYRQDDQEFINVLNHIRMGTFDRDDINVLNKHVNLPSANEQTICLYPQNNVANRINSLKYNAINSNEVVFKGSIMGDFNVDTMTNVDTTIKLKVGAQVMTMVNAYALDGTFLYYNGSIGTVTVIDSNKHWIRVKMADTGTEVTVNLYVWKNVIQEYDKENDRIIQREIGSFTQIPVRLAWAITIHKSQGLSLSSVQMDVNGAFQPGQTYVALSRCRNLAGLHLESPVGPGAIIVDKRAMLFYNAVHKEFERIFKEIKTIQALYKEAIKSFENSDGAAFVNAISKARVINNFITKYIHTEFADYLSKFATKCKSDREQAIKSVEIELKNQTLQKELDEANNSISELEAENTSLYSKCQMQESRIARLDADLKSSHQQVKQLEEDNQSMSQQYRDIQQRFIDKTIELDNLKKTPWYKRLFKIGW